VWFDAANAAGMTAEKDWTAGFAVDKHTEDFLKGWLCGTPGGEEALAAWLKQRGYGRQASGAN
jgi:hypothetical protein